MTNEDKKLIFEYCGWDWTYVLKHPFAYHPLNSNGILEAVRVMVSNGDIVSFENYTEEKWRLGNIEETILAFQCKNFFPLMAEWLKEKNKEDK